MEHVGRATAEPVGDDRLARVVALVRQLRSPAHTISGLVELLAETPEHAAAFAATLGSETASLLVTIEQLSDLVDPTLRPPALAPRPSAELDGGLVLVVDDSPVNQLLVTSQLAKLGVASATAPSGVKALDLLAEQRFDAVLMDWHMPGMDGLETAAALRHHESSMGLARTPVIAVTARAMLGDRERCLAAGMDDFLAKPLGLDDLARALSVWMPLSPRRVGPGRSDDARRSADPPALVDLSVLQQLAEELGDRTIVVTLVETYVAEIPERLNELIGAMAAGDLEVVERVAHTLKSTSEMLGATPLSGLAAELERASTGEISADLVDLVERLVDLAERTRADMSAASTQVTLSR